MNLYVPCSRMITYQSFRFFNLLSILFLVMTGCDSPKDVAEDANKYDIIVYGGTSAGVIAAYSAAQLDKSVLLMVPGTHLGGMTSGGLGQTDIGNKFVVKGLSRNFYRRVGEHYGNFENWQFAPHVADSVYQNFIDRANVEVLKQHRVINVDKEGKTINAITLEHAEAPGASQRTISGDMFIDCSYEGDLMARAGVSYTVGRESNDKYGETYNGVQLRGRHQFPDGVDPYVEKGNPESGLLWGISDNELAPQGSGDNKVQAYNFRICLTNQEDNMIPITRPENYDSTRYNLLVRLFEAQPDQRSLHDYFIWSMMPNHKTDINNKGGFSTDMIGMNHAYPEASYEEREAIWQKHEDYTKGLLYFYAHDPRVPDTLQKQMRQWGYPEDEFVNNDHFPNELYVREVRRMVGEYVMTEHHCVGDSVVSDPIAQAAYTMDSHNCQRLVTDGMAKNEGNVEIGGFPPYPVSYRSLVPKVEECDNLLVPVCLSASHIAFGSIRMEPVFMVLGQVASMAANEAINKDLTVQEVDAQNVRERMANDPYLDGSKPDVHVDDADEGNITASGDWETREEFMDPFKGSYLVSETPQNATVRFSHSFYEDGRYMVKYNCPALDDTPLTGQVTLEIQHAGGTETVTINMQENRNGWAHLGTFDFEAGEEAYVEVKGAQSAAPLVADAVLFVPVE